MKLNWLPLGVYEVKISGISRRWSFNVVIICIIAVLTACSDKDSPVLDTAEPDKEQMEEDTSATEQPPMNGPRFYRSVSYEFENIGATVYFPSDYDSLSRYPVIYVNDGDLHLEIWARWLSLEADPFIMVALNANNTRYERFTPYIDERILDAIGEYTPGAEAYSREIAEQVMPFINEHYRVTRPAIMGISLGGLHATWMALQYPKLFAFVGALSPSYWVAGRSVLNESYEPWRPVGLSRPIQIYFDRGSAEWRNFVPFVEQLKQKELKYGESIFYYEVQNGDHETFDWANRIEVPFRLYMEGVKSSSIADFSVTSYCAEDLDADSRLTGRINPLVEYDNGVVYSVMTEAEFAVEEGSGSVSSDGTYIVNSGNSMVVRVTYGELSAQVTVQVCK